MNLFPLRLPFLLVAGLSPLTAETPPDPSLHLPETVGFNRDIRPIFSKTCFECHGPDAKAREAKLRFDVREVATAKRKKGTPIIPGDAANSLAYQLITTDDPDDVMPPEDFHTVLSPREKALIEKWINQGAEYQTHWSFIPPAKPSPPDVKHASAVRNPIDTFVISKLETAGLSPAPMADRRTLIRRVSLDLTGLPPTPEEIRAFIADPASDDDAYAKVVDRLLASPASANTAPATGSMPPATPTPAAINMTRSATNGSGATGSSTPSTPTSPSTSSPSSKTPATSSPTPPIRPVSPPASIAIIRSPSRAASSTRNIATNT